MHTAFARIAQTVTPPGCFSTCYSFVVPCAPRAASLMAVQAGAGPLLHKGRFAVRPYSTLTT